MSIRLAAQLGACTLALAAFATPATADTAIGGPAGAFERDYLGFILDHHYSGLRVTELAAGTAAVGPTVPPGPWPADPATFAPSEARGTNPVVLDVARRSNAAQEMEINEGERFLQEWYGTVAPLSLPPSGEQLISTLEGATPGDPFNIAFLTGFSEHHLEAISRSLECVSRAGHAELREYCGMIVQAQTGDVLTMRAELARTYGISVDTPIPGQVPEPASWALVGLGLAVMGRLRTRRPDTPATV